MFPLWNPRRKLYVDSLGMLGAYKTGGAIGKSPNDEAKEVDTDAISMVAHENRPFCATCAGVTHEDLKSDMMNGKPE